MRGLSHVCSLLCSLPHRHQSDFNHTLLNLLRFICAASKWARINTTISKEMGQFETCSHVIYTLQQLLLHVYDPISFHFISFSVLFKTLCQFRMHFNLFSFCYFFFFFSSVCFFSFSLLVLSFHFVPSAMMQFAFNNCEMNSAAMALWNEILKYRKWANERRESEWVSEWARVHWMFYLYFCVILIDGGKFSVRNFIRTNMNLIHNFGRKNLILPIEFKRTKEIAN